MNVTIFFIVFKKCYDLCYKPNQSFIKTMATYVQIIEIVVTNVTQFFKLSAYYIQRITCTNFKFIEYFNIRCQFVNGKGNSENVYLPLLKQKAY